MIFVEFIRWAWSRPDAGFWDGFQRGFVRGNTIGLPLALGLLIWWFVQ